MPAPEEPIVVGIGASAGGIEALQGLFQAMPADTGLSFVVVMHLPADRTSALPEIVGRMTRMPVAQAKGGEAMLPDHVYVAPPNAVLVLEDARLQVRRQEARADRNGVDVFLASLGQDRGERAIAVILSGAGSDGALGVKTVKERGGLTIAQGADGTAPRHAGMPRSAIATGVVDLELSVEDIPGKLVDYVRSFGELAVLGEGDAGDAGIEASREAVCAILRERVGHDFGGYKRRTFLRRVQRRMQVLQQASLEAYIERLRREPEEVTLLFRDLLIGVTNFFRDKEAFAALESLVIPRLLEGRSAADTLRAWVPGCSTGEEVYSLAIMVRETMDRLGAAPKVQLFATDIDDAALEVARAARYPEAMIEGMPKERLRRFFTHDGGTWHLSKPVRDMCIFSSHSLIRDPPFSRIDLVSCRNLLIYLDAEVQARVIPVFHYALRKSGYLFLGGSESVTQHTDLFAAIDKKSRIFQRRDHVAPIHFPLLMPGLRLPSSGRDSRQETLTAGLTLRRAAEQRVLERFAPAHVVVNREGDMVHYSARTGKYLESPAGQPSRHLVALARKGLRLELRAALQQALETRRPVLRERVAVEFDGRTQPLDLRIEPLHEQDADPLFIVLFTDVGPPFTPEEAQARGAPAEPGADAERLERELRDTRERLQSLIEEYETALEELKSANEELVSVNEELQSTNEELETSKEETQSINEELHTVNQELGSKVDLLNQANGDLRNLFESTGIAIVFLDRELVVRSFTPSVSEVFSLIPGDRGRPLLDISTHLDEEGIEEGMRAVVAGHGPVERRVARRDGKASYLMRMLPYRGAEGALEGIILTFLDITGIVAAERQQQTLIHELNHRVRNMLAVVVAIAAQTLAGSGSPQGFADAFMGRIEALARAYGIVAREQWKAVTLGGIVREELEPYLDGSEGRASLDGPPVMLQPKAALALGMIVHELATNAVKYGALSVPEGRVAVSWAGAAGRLRLDWRESGGPAPRTEAAAGFGSELIRRQARDELGGEIEVDFPIQGA